MIYEKMTEDKWIALIFAITQGNCILAIGPEIVTKKADGEEVPIVQLLAEDLARKLPDGSMKAGPQNLTHVAQQFHIHKGRNALLSNANLFYRAVNQEPLDCDILEDLATLPFQLILYSTPDNRIEKALEKNGKKCNKDWYNYKRPTGSPETNVSDSPLVYHLFGAVDSPESLVLSENNLLDYLVAVISKKPSLPTHITSEIKSRDKSFLFLGFGLHNWYLRVLMKVMFEGQKENYSIALEELGTGDDPMVLFFKKEFKIQFCEAKNIKGFAEELRKRYEAEVDQTKPSRISADDLSPNTPLVFICHASEDKPSAIRLSEELKVSGIRTWLDKDDIFPGADWDQTIKKVINTVDYVIVLQSRNMVTQKESYFYKEIKLARNRASRQREGALFIFPVRLDDCELLSELEHLQTRDIDLNNMAGISDLVKEIKRDHQKSIKL